MMRLAVAASVLAIALLLSGCAPSPTSEYSDETASALQAGVLEVTETSAAGDYEAAMVRLDELEASLKDALAKGTVTTQRYESVLAAIALVRADLTAELAQQEVEEEQDSKPGNGGGKGNDKDKDD